MEKEFIEKLKEAFEIEDHEINMTDEFRNYKEWNSLAYLSLIAMFDDDYNIQIEESDFKKLRTIADLYAATKKG